MDGEFLASTCYQFGFFFITTVVLLELFEFFEDFLYCFVILGEECNGILVHGVRCFSRGGFHRVFSVGW